MATRNKKSSGNDLPENPYYEATSTGGSGQSQDTVDPNMVLSAVNDALTTANQGNGTGAPAPGADGMANLTGWAANQNFNPTELEHIYANPQAILPYVFGGMQPGSPGYNRLRNLGWDPLAMFTMTEGAGSMLGDAEGAGGVGGYANFLNQLYQAIGSAGGRAVNAQELIRNIFGQEGTGTGDSQTALGQMLGAGDATQQARTLYNLIRDVTEAGMNPLAAQAMQAATMNMLDRYNSSVLTADSESVPSAVDWVNQNAPWLTALG